MTKKLDYDFPGAEDALARFSVYWDGLSDEEREIAENVTLLTARVGGRKAAAEAMGVGATTLDNYRSGKTQPKYLELIKLLRAAQAIEKEVLANLPTIKSAQIRQADAAEMADSVERVSFTQLTAQVDRMSQQIGSIVQRLEPPPPPPATIKFFPQAASAGWGRAVLDDEGVEELDMEAFASRLLGLAPDHVTLFPIKGDSMYPTLQQRDYAVVDRRKRRIVDDAIFIVSIDNDLYIKRAKRGDDDACCWLSDNPDQSKYPPICLKGDEISRIKVIGRVTNFFRAI